VFDQSLTPEPKRPAEPPERQLVLRAVWELSGFDRALFYDVPRSEAPERIPGSPVYLRGSPAWHFYLMERREVDDGRLTPIISPRPLSDGERLLAVDWGSTFANTFLLIEPSDAACDLTDPSNPAFKSLEQAAKKLLEHKTPNGDPGVAWTRETAVGSILRVLYGNWIYWTGTYGDRRSHSVQLSPLRPSDTLAGLLLPQLRDRFPQPAFNQALEDLYARELELFHGAVTTARMPFRTRLGLPILHDPRYADRALRHLVNSGRARVHRRIEDSLFRYGANRPVPAGMTEAEFEGLLL